MPYLHPVYFLYKSKKLKILLKKQDRELNSFSFHSPLFMPEAFHTGNYTEIAHKQKSPTLGEAI
jgi:hypothetical protein